MKSLVGYSGFVGSNLAANYQFDGLYNSKNIQDAFSTKPELLVYAGVPAEKFLANKEPEKDFALIVNAAENIRKISPQKLVLISTIDVYKKPVEIDEHGVIEIEGLHPYGYNRRWLELEMLSSGIETLVIRLPALLGANIKKNFIYDLINIVPSMLTEKKYFELCKINSLIGQSYVSKDNGYYMFKPKTELERNELRSFFASCDFNALSFTDSRSTFQFYSLAYLWEHITIAYNHGIRELNLATEPITVAEIYSEINNGDQFINILNNYPAFYDFRTVYANLFGGSNGYLFSKQSVMNDIKEFIKQNSKRLS